MRVCGKVSDKVRCESPNLVGPAGISLQQIENLRYAVAADTWAHLSNGALKAAASPDVVQPAARATLSKSTIPIFANTLATFYIACIGMLLVCYMLSLCSPYAKHLYSIL
jgi:hypothetical protein